MLILNSGGLYNVWKWTGISDESEIYSHRVHATVAFNKTVLLVIFTANTWKECLRCSLNDLTGRASLQMQFRHVASRRLCLREWNRLRSTRASRKCFYMAVVIVEVKCIYVVVSHAFNASVRYTPSFTCPMQTTMIRITWNHVCVW